MPLLSDARKALLMGTDSLPELHLPLAASNPVSVVADAIANVMSFYQAISYIYDTNKYDPWD